MARYLLLVPGGLRTGGPEALYQLSDMLMKIGATSAMIQMTGDNLKKISAGQMCGLGCDKSLIVDEYKKYKFNYVDSINNDDIVVVPECYLSLIPVLLRKNKCVIWWLSVDNAFGALAGLNFTWFHHPRVRHVVQSDYAMRFLMSMGLKSKYLTDYVALDDWEVGVEKGKFCITFNAGAKVPYDIAPHLRAIARDLNLECVPLIGLDKKTCEDFLRKSIFYIDMGKNPGKDRAPREAIIAGAMVFVSKVGAGFSDYLVPDYYRVDPWNIIGLRDKMHRAFNERDIYLRLLNDSREKLMCEVINFEKEVVDLVVDDGWN
jgi:hypothetical protein